MACFSDEEVRVALCGPQTMRRYPFPGNSKVEVGIKLLTDAEIDGVRLRAVETAKGKKAELLIDPHFLERLIQREIVASAFLDPDAKEKRFFFADQEQVATLDNHSVLALYEQYNLHAKSMDPYAHCSVEEADELAEQMGKSENSVVFLSLLDIDGLRNLSLSLALRNRELLALLPPK